MACVRSCSDGAIGICRMIQVVFACLFLFIGITCQFYAGLNIHDVSLGNLCDTYSGSPVVMDRAAFDELIDGIQTAACASNEACCDTKRSDACIDYDEAAAYYLSSSPARVSTDNRVDLLRNAGPYFWCRYVPQGADEKTCRQKLDESPGVDPQPCKVWSTQASAPDGKGHWFLASSVSATIEHINCNEKTQVYIDFLRAVYGSLWSDGEIEAASTEFYSSCVVDKGSNGFILIIGPLTAMLGGVLSTLTMFESFHRPPWPDIGVNLLLIGAILLLVGFWSISISTSAEILAHYTWCGDVGLPLVEGGRWYDLTPCIDRDSRGAKSWNPFVSRLLSFDSTYIAGGVLNILATCMFMGLVTGFTERLVEGRVGKYLISSRDFFVPRLPFPSRTGSPARDAASERS